MVTSQKFNSGDFISLQVQGDKEDKESNATASRVHGNDHGNKTIKIYYSTTDVKVSEVIDIIDLATFVGSIGGNLGLFLGFSFLGLFNAVWDFLPQLRHGMMNYF